MFEERKKKALEKLNEAIKNKEVDEPIKNFLIKINEYKNVYTTSSCAGRIIVLVDKGSKKDSFFAGKWHDLVKAEIVWNRIVEYSKESLVWLKQEPFILHIVCKKLKDAANIIKIARDVGFKHSGIISMKKEKIVCEINGIDRVEIPAVINGKIVISKDFFYDLIDFMNSKLLRNKYLREKFFENLFKYLDYSNK
jgi:tRNA wybutosine-synthesizing protein 3